MEVKFWPKKHVDVEICDIWHDKDAVIVQHTDTLQANTGWYVEALGFKYGIRPTAFVWPFSGITTGLEEVYKSGVLKFGVYIPTDHYAPETGTPKVLPDYVGNTITNQISAEYYGKNIGDAKPANGPNQGQEIFNYTEGVKGFDVVHGIAGEENNGDFTRLMEYVDSWYFGQFGRLPSGGADRQGRIGSKEIYQPYYLGIRDTNFNGNTSYGKSKNGAFLGSPGKAVDRVAIMENLLTSRWENGFINDQIPLYNTRLVNGINDAFDYKGLFNDFVHWHRAITFADDITLLEDLYQLIHESVNGRNAWYTGFGEAMEYLWYREMASRAVGTIIGDKVHLFLDFVDGLKNEIAGGVPSKLAYNRIKTPLTVKVDLTGTSLSGKGIKSSYGKPVSLGSNIYLIDIPFGFDKEGIKGVVLSETDSPKYFNNSYPDVSASISGSTLTLTTNIPTRAVLFTGNFAAAIPAPVRSNELGLTHVFEGVGSDDYMVGAISEDGISSLKTA